MRAVQILAVFEKLTSWHDLLLFIEPNWGELHILEDLIEFCLVEAVGKSFWNDIFFVEASVVKVKLGTYSD